MAAPVLLAAALLYQVLATLQISVGSVEALLIVGGVVGLALAAGFAAAWGPPIVRAAVFAGCLVLWLDAGFDLQAAFGSQRGTGGVDAVRGEDVRALRDALERYVERTGTLPAPVAYGEGTGHPSFWQGWWDLSSDDRDGDGRPFLDFLIEEDVMARVPLDPVNSGDPASREPTGHQYVFYVAPPGYGYQGGHCGGTEQGAYLLGVTGVEGNAPPRSRGDEGCDCFWREAPGFFDGRFAYAVCGTFPR